MTVPAFAFISDEQAEHLRREHDPSDCHACRAMASDWLTVARSWALSAADHDHEPPRAEGPEDDWPYDRLPTPPEQLRGAEIEARIKRAARVAACDDHDENGPTDTASGFPTCSKCSAILSEGAAPQWSESDEEQSIEAARIEDEAVDAAWHAKYHEGAAPRAEDWQTHDDKNWLRSHREHDGHWRCSGVGDNGEPCEVIRAAPRAEGLDVERLMWANQMASGGALMGRDYATEVKRFYDMTFAQDAEAEAFLSRPSDERVPESEEPR